MSMTEEKKTISHKTKLEGQRSKVQRFKEISEELDKLYKTHEPSLKKQKVIYYILLRIGIEKAKI